MNEKEQEKHFEAVKPAKSSCWESDCNDSDLPQYSDIDYSSHLDNLEKGRLCLRPIRALSHVEKKSQEASMNASENSIKSVLWLIICPAKVARIPQATVKVLVLGGLFAVLAFWICMFVVSYLLDLFILLLDQLNLWIASILGFDTTLERNDLAGDNPIPLNTIPTESQNLSNDPNILADEQPSSECVEQFPERQQKPSQSRGVESTLNLESS